MTKLLFFLPFFFFAACVSNPVDPIQELLSKPMTEADSLHYMDLLFEAMEEERMEYLDELNLSCPYMQGWFMGCGLRCQVYILTNSEGGIMVYNELTSEVKEFLVKYYTHNMQSNDVTGNFPLYSRIDSASISEQVKRMEEEIEMVKSHEDKENHEDTLKYLEIKKDEWRKMEKSIGTLNLNSISQLPSSCKIHIDCTNSSGLEEFILNEVLNAYYEVRNIRAEEFFNESYLSIYRRLMLAKQQSDRDKIEALSVLHPIHIVFFGEDCIIESELPPEPISKH